MGVVALQITEVNPQSKKAKLPMLVTVFGIVTEVKNIQVSNASPIMLVTE